MGYATAKAIPKQNTNTEFNDYNKGIPKNVAAQPPGCSKVKVQLGKFRRAAEKTKQRKHRVEEIQKAKKRLSHRDAFRPYSRVSSGGRTDRETNWKTPIFVKSLL